ncbi:winged helix DNA-binding protein [Mucilaginibacter frigoritolerans]|uniref:Winged helix DNA-binding protein n=1 Tax=Mucilaginibacter frigoritolerans TaxID=652788 RepID=A0A562TLJ5_9SPHI|nr:winged helix DNA-binding domain-containing protein [Mucilaginibacter frigoritolerans]TWI94372.1 winged helix DNA-binding protein [Mucilaginibacter frigoritolerans]
MTYQDIAQQRIYNQYIVNAVFKQPADIVKYMGAIQAQDYAGAKWAVGLRLKNGKDAAVDKALADGSIIRTHVLRPTWHFVSPYDLRWMLDLTAARIKAAAAPWYKKLELDAAVLKKCNDVLARALEGNKQLNRAEIMTVLQQAGIATDDLRFVHLLMWAELEKVICSGGRQGKQFTYALFDDRVPLASPKAKEEALAELAGRYFTSRSPATLQDFTWWSGLTTADAKTGLELVKADLLNLKMEGVDYWMGSELPDNNIKVQAAHLLPAFDEFAVSYKDRTAAVKHEYLTQARYVIFDPSIVVNNQIVGTWKRTINKTGVDITVNLFGKLNKTQTAAVDAAAIRYLKFMKG